MLRSCVSEIVLVRIRFFYYTKLGDVILIFHAFRKKSQKTPPNEIALAQTRLKDMLE
ncbi:MAG TPA: type II toxin-antitoxin system RelE/ParE family toxin [Pyrinomonadaceae bacterium]